MALSQAVWASCFDASALVKLYVNEQGSCVLRRYFHSQPNKYTTPFCFFETLTILKMIHFYRKALSAEEYHEATFGLTAWFGAFSESLPDIKLTEPQALHRALELAGKHTLDLSDAFQILSVKAGYYSPLVGGSQTVLVTADRNLADAARAEGVRVWNLISEPPPA
ncbi:MAG TPA: type II toxin-antitoxin system VapC family toxin [Stellaceae bacterium]|jgi:predicted nucleic acid-binding protein|nr:type II toxin-antitoxin system VapC family toxin [Stellaceae bacterium]